MDKKIILIIDDNPLTIKLLDYLLTTKGYETHSASNANEVFNLLQTLQPNLILMDIQLPGMDGLELTRRLKSEKKYKNIPIIAITAFAMKGDKEKTLNAGCDGYIAKPIDIRTFPDIIAEHLQAHKKS